MKIDGGQLVFWGLVAILAFYGWRKFGRTQPAAT